MAVMLVLVLVVSVAVAEAAVRMWRGGAGVRARVSCGA